MKRKIERSVVEINDDHEGCQATCGEARAEDKGAIERERTKNTHSDCNQLISVFLDETCFFWAEMWSNNFVCIFFCSFI